MSTQLSNYSVVSWSWPPKYFSSCLWTRSYESGWCTTGDDGVLRRLSGVVGSSESGLRQGAGTRRDEGIDILYLKYRIFNESKSIRHYSLFFVWFCVGMMLYEEWGRGCDQLKFEELTSSSYGKKDSTRLCIIRESLFMNRKKNQQYRDWYKDRTIYPHVTFIILFIIKLEKFENIMNKLTNV